MNPQMTCLHAPNLLPNAPEYILQPIYEWSLHLYVWGFVVVFMEIEHSGEKKGALHP